jgi:hypothetical protein
MIDHQREMLERVLRSLSQRLPNNRDFLKPLQNYNVPATDRPRPADMLAMFGRSPNTLSPAQSGAFSCARHVAGRPINTAPKFSGSSGAARIAASTRVPCARERLAHHGSCQVQVPMRP